MNLSVNKPSALRVWFTALRPFSFSVSMLPVLLGAVLAWSTGYSFRWEAVCLLLASVVCLHGAANVLNDYYDFTRGLDHQVYPVSGALVRGWVRGPQIWRAALGLLCFGAVLSLVVIVKYGLGLFVMAVLGGLLVVGYTRKGVCLKYLGLGDLAIFLAFGVLPVLAGWWVLASAFSWQPIWWSIAPGLLAVSILHANNWRDRENDAAHGCRTLAVRIGFRASYWYWQGLLVSAILLPTGVALAAAVGLSVAHAPVWVLLVWLLLPQFVRLMRVRCAVGQETMGDLDAQAARLHVMFCGLLCLGLLLGRY